MDEFLTRYASHHLTQVVLRDGHGSPRHEDAVRAVDDLLVAFDYAELRTPASELPALLRAGDILLCQGAGDIGGLAPKLLKSELFAGAVAASVEGKLK